MSISNLIHGQVNSDSFGPVSQLGKRLRPQGMNVPGAKHSAVPVGSQASSISFSRIGEFSTMLSLEEIKFLRELDASNADFETKYLHPQSKNVSKKFNEEALLNPDHCNRYSILIQQIKRLIQDFKDIMKNPAIEPILRKQKIFSESELDANQKEDLSLAHVTQVFLSVKFNLEGLKTDIEHCKFKNNLSGMKDSVSRALFFSLSQESVTVLMTLSSDATKVKHAPRRFYTFMKHSLDCNVFESLFLNGFFPANSAGKAMKINTLHAAIACTRNLETLKKVWPVVVQMGGVPVENKCHQYSSDSRTLVLQREAEIPGFLKTVIELSQSNSGNEKYRNWINELQAIYNSSLLKASTIEL